MRNSPITKVHGKIQIHFFTSLLKELKATWTTTLSEKLIYNLPAKFPNCLHLFSTPIALKTSAQPKYAMTAFNILNGNTKTWPSSFAFSGDAKLGHVVLQRTAKKCTKIYNARAQLLFCSLNLLFGCVLVPRGFLKLPEKFSSLVTHFCWNKLRRLRDEYKKHLRRRTLGDKGRVGNKIGGEYNSLNNGMIVIWQWYNRDKNSQNFLLFLSCLARQDLICYVSIIAAGRQPFSTKDSWCIKYFRFSI